MTNIKLNFDSARYCRNNAGRMGKWMDGSDIAGMIADEVERLRAELAALKSNGGQAQECNCDMRTKLVGDGCEVCNPTLALEHAKETIADLRAELAELREAAKAAKVDWECCILTGQSTAYDNLARLCGEE